MVKQQDKLSEKQILLVYAHHLLEPLLPKGELLIDKCIGADETECPFCPEKKHAVKTGSTAFGNYIDFSFIILRKKLLLQLTLTHKMLSKPFNTCLRT